MNPVPENQRDQRVTVLLLLAVALVLPHPRSTAGPAPAFCLDADQAVRRLPCPGEPTRLLAGDTDTLPPEIALFFNRPFQINMAGHSALTMLPGIGPRLADRILAHRASHGPFTSASDLVRVRGIGPDRAARLAPLLSFR